MSIVIGILQFSSTSNLKDNVNKILELLNKRHVQADLVVLPEYSMINILGGLKPVDIYSIAGTLNNSTYLDSLSCLAVKYGIHILTHFIEKTSSPPKCYSSSVLVKPDGSRELIYRKIHLFDAYGYRESDYFIPGDTLSEEVVINGVRIRVAICFDIRFPELFRRYALYGAELVIVHSGWVKGPLKEEILEFLARSRAHENTYWVVVVDQCGRGYVGRSMVVDPYGVKAVDLGFREDYIEYTIDTGLVYKARETIPVVSKARDKWRIEFRETR